MKMLLKCCYKRLGFKSTYVTGPVSLVFAIKYMASKEWDRMRYGRIRATRFTDRGPISLVKRKPPPEDFMELGTCGPTNITQISSLAHESARRGLGRSPPPTGQSFN